ncbi:MAG: metallophosphoesterase family protein [Ruminococcus sp.]|nr:metallophosphoesterase family protein [Ruminococcus sp.]
MKILLVSDVESPLFYEYYSEGRLEKYDLIISCGDLKTEYLEFLVTMARCPLLYVHGNHDENNRREPEGCICIDNKVFNYKGIRFLGLGGSHKYRNGKYMYTEKQMKRRLLKLNFQIRRNKGFDILVTHAPARHLNDLETIAHRGFDCFNTLLNRYEPRLFVHGHVHRNYNTGIPQKTQHGKTTVINAYEYCVIELPDLS